MAWKELINLAGTSTSKLSLASGVGSLYSCPIINLDKASNLVIGAEVDWPSQDNSIQLQVLSSPNSVNWDSSSNAWASVSVTYIQSSTQMNTDDITASPAMVKVNLINKVSSGSTDVWAFATVTRRGR